MIDVWGADHGGYFKRMNAAVGAVTGREGDLDVKICQIVGHELEGTGVLEPTEEQLDRSRAAARY